MSTRPGAGVYLIALSTRLATARCSMRRSPCTSSGAAVSLLAGLLTVAAGLLMVSNFRYYSFKELDLQGRVPFMVLVLVMLGFALVVLDPPILLFVMFLGYAMSGPILTLVRRRQHRGRRRRER